MTISPDWVESPADPSSSRPASTTGRRACRCRHARPARRRGAGAGRCSPRPALAVIAVAAGTGGAAGYVAGAPATRSRRAGRRGRRAAARRGAVRPGRRRRPGAARRGLGAGAQRLRRRRSGSGFVFDDRGHIVTNNHVVGGGRRQRPVSVVGSDGRRLTAEVVGTDPGSDIAVLRVTPTAALRPLDLADPSATRVGEPVLAVGSPLGLSGTVTAGIVSALDRQVRLGGTARQTAVQTDASINPGNSGGPLVNARGEVVGVNTAIATLEGGGNIGIGFAVPIDRAQQVARNLISRG